MAAPQGPDQAAVLQYLMHQMTNVMATLQPGPVENQPFEQQLQRLTAAKAAELAAATADPNAPQLQQQGKLQAFEGRKSDISFKLWMVQYYSQRNAVNRSTLVTKLGAEPLNYLVDHEANTHELGHDEILRFLAQRYWDTTSPFKALDELNRVCIDRTESVVEFNIRFLHLATTANVVTQP